MSLNQLNFRDLEWIVGIRSVRSLRDFARVKRVQVAHASKIFQNIEYQLGVKIFIRSPRGIEITEDGAALIGLCEELLAHGDRIREFSQKQADKKGKKGRKLITIGALSFLQNFLVLDSLEGLDPDFRMVELNPTFAPQLQLMPEMDAFLHLGPIDWPSEFATSEVGLLDFGFYMHTNHRPKKITVNDLYRLPFILPTLLGNGRLIQGVDRCPIPIHLRVRGDETTTSQQAVELLYRRPQVAFLPEIVARKKVKSGEICLLEFSEFPKVREMLHLSVKIDQVSNQLLKGLLERMKSNLEI